MALFRRIVLVFVAWSDIAAAAEERRAPGRGLLLGHAQDDVAVAPTGRSVIPLRTSSNLKG